MRRYSVRRELVFPHWAPQRLASPSLLTPKSPSRPENPASQIVCIFSPFSRFVGRRAPSLLGTLSLVSLCYDHHCPLDERKGIPPPMFRYDVSMTSPLNNRAILSVCISLGPFTWRSAALRTKAASPLPPGVGSHTVDGMPRDDLLFRTHYLLSAPEKIARKMPRQRSRCV